MTFDLARILESKAIHRRQLAALSIADKLRMLDALRERELSIRGSASVLQNAQDTATLKEDPCLYKSTLPVGPG